MTDNDRPESDERRAFFQRMIGKKPEEPAQTGLPRPPWSIEESEFLALCAQCHACIDACPQRLLKPSDEVDTRLKGRPVLDLSWGSCDFCGQCADVCTTNAINKQQGKKAQAAPMLLGNCQNLLGMDCNLCIEACPEQALIAQRQQHPILNKSRCSGCGECVLSCQSHILVMAKR
ncbi:NAD(P)H-quinone oxidoreductase subunit I, chloroplastic [invertebrate metagenome]|uniref:NAD(P)H-quinone oxidoreductase subunit I, chloroplastic n=1 Tax=invertebrate metagenome TaxID=1711999 RepID=A0A2H9T5H2_9ZZZZ